MESKGDVRSFPERAPVDFFEMPPGSRREPKGSGQPRQPEMDASAREIFVSAQPRQHCLEGAVGLGNPMPYAVIAAIARHAASFS